MDVSEVARRLSELKAPPGRMERYGGIDAPLIMVDYAHTPDALENALQALRPVAAARGGRLWCVFGCGGDRDKGKRPQMGNVASKLADEVLITSDNPRSEVPADIIKDIVQGAPLARVESDRALAIACAITEAGDADVILLAGKGHEPYQDIAGVKYPFADGAQAEQALAVRAQARRAA